jgi:hypothetical protein
MLVGVTTLRVRPTSERPPLSPRMISHRLAEPRGDSPGGVAQLDYRLFE